MGILFKKKWWIAIACGLLFVALSLFGYHTQTDLLKVKADTASAVWTVEDGTLVSYNGTEREVVIPEIYEGQTITKIGENAFAENTALIRVEMPDTVKEIADYAFYNCKSLASVQLSSSLESLGTWAFGYCEKIENIDLPNGLKTIGSATFYGCSELNGIIMPDTVTSIGTHSFRGCFDLSQVVLSSSLKTIPYRAFSGCNKLLHITLPEGLTSIGDEAFYQSGINKITFPTSFESLGVRAFYQCKNLTEVIALGLTEVKEEAFFGCVGLKKVDFGTATTKTIDKKAFYDCSSLKEIVFPKTLKEIGESAFENCPQIEELSFPETLVSIGANAFNGSRKVLQLVIPQNVANIGEDAFAGCTRLIEIYNLSSLPILKGDSKNGGVARYARCIHSDITQTGCLAQMEDGFVFYSNENDNDLVAYKGNEQSIVLPEEINGRSYNIYNEAFSGCFDIIQITIPKGVLAIGENAFKDCIILTKVHYVGTMAQWAEIKIGTGNINLITADIVCDGGKTDSEIGDGSDPNYFGPSVSDSSWSTAWERFFGDFLDGVVENIFALNFFLILLWGILLIYNKPNLSEKKKRRNKIIFVVIACLQWILISGLRADSVGDDTENYMLFFDEHSALSWNKVFKGLGDYINTGKMGSVWYLDTEPLFVVFNKLVSVFTTDHVVYKFLIAIIFMSALGRYVYKYSKDPCLSFILYGGLFFNMFSLTGYRQVLAVALILFGFRFIKERKLVSFLILLFFAYFFHRTSLIFILLYVLANKKITPNYILIGVAALVGLIVFRSQVFVLVRDFVGYEEYVGNYGFKQEMFMLLLGIITFGAFWRFKEVTKEEPGALLYYNGLILSWFMMPLAMESPSCMRLVYNFAFVLMLLVPLIVQSFREKRDRILLYIAIYGVFMINVLTSEFTYAFYWQ